jgi:signal transduction histidine kinase
MVDQHISARSSRVVAFARAFLAVFLLLSVTVGALKYADAQHAAKIVLVAYCLYSLLIAAAVRTVQLRRHLFSAALALSVIDVVALGALMYLTQGGQGQSAPFFTPLIFIILSGTVNWGSRGAAGSGLLVLLLFLPTGFMTDVFNPAHKNLLQLFLMRIGYIGTITVMLAAFASNLERLINELTRLSRVPSRGGFGEMPLAESLGYAMDVFAAKRGVIVWQDPEEPHLKLVRKDFGAFHGSSLPNVDQGPLVASELINAPFLYDRRRNAVLYRAGTKLLDFTGDPLQPILASMADYARVLVIPIDAGVARGLVMILDPADPVNEDLAVAAMAAGQLSLTIEAWQLHSELRIAAASEERVRLARDLHDGVLQFLAGARLQLDLISSTKLDDAARARVEQMIEAIGEEQRSLRAVINAMRRAPEIAVARLSSSLDHLTSHLSRSWDATISAAVEPSDLTVSDSMEDDVVRIAREAVANAVRHGGARRIDIEVRQNDDRLDIAIGDDGRGFAFQGRMANGELASYAGRPRSLHDRIIAMGGTMVVTSAKSGASIEVSVPLKGIR